MFYIIGALFAIVIGVILMINVMGGGSQGSSGSQISTTVNEVNQLRTGVRTLGYTNSFTGLDNDVLEVGGVMPPELIAGVVGAGDDLDTWGGAITVTSAVPSCMEVELTQVPQAACVALASQVVSYCPGDSTEVINGNTVTVTSNVPMSPGTAAGYCNSPDETLIWEFNN